jgi:hypothetical protein
VPKQLHLQGDVLPGAGTTLSLVAYSTAIKIIICILDLQTFFAKDGNCVVISIFHVVLLVICISTAHN